jgi:hypothetical protein
MSSLDAIACGEQADGETTCTDSTEGIQPMTDHSNQNNQQQGSRITYEDFNIE